MFIKTLQIQNFKCFDNEVKSLDFNIPDGQTLGSGLNIFVGDNNSGKSTIFEGVDFLRDNTSKDLKDIKNKKSSNDDEMFVEVIFTGKITDVIDNFSQQNKKEVFKKYIYKNEDESEEYFKLSRSSKNIKALQLWNNDESKFKNEAGIDAPLKKLFETNFVWSDTNPNAQASFGSTTICGNLLKEIVKKFEETEDYTNFSSQFHKTFNDEESGLRKELKQIEEKTQKIFSEQFSDAKISFHFDELKIDSFFKNTKVEVDDGIPTYMEEKGSGMQRSVALALLQVYAEELVKHPENQDAVKPFFLFIDEPEICLHPQAQMKLLKAILELSKTKQIFIATHSPYFFKNPDFKNTGLFLFKKDENQKVEISNIKDENWGILPWSPSWGEINYHAYDLPTVEFHNELYGYLQELSGKTSISEFDNYLKNDKNIADTKSYQRNGNTETITLCSYIRNQIHHPENTSNTQYTDEELKKSVDLLIGAIKSNS
ncbi:MAG TPA: AAA family ATPase [Candidatus Absconditabacterales bacterium]|nr:AAA family ATPase [Candidatus Absconditabacterales bacterium]